MAHISILDESLSFESPMLVEGLPGVGLVGKIAADHLIESFDMTHYANVHCDGIPRTAVYSEDSSAFAPPVRLYADVERDLLVLQSDVPISPKAATEFASCVTGWLQDNAVTPIYLSGLSREERESPPELYGAATGDGESLLDPADIQTPDEPGMVSGPTGALINHAVETGTTSVGLIVESDPQFPDPEAARVLIKDGIEPLTGIEVDVSDLVEHAEQIREAKESLAQQMQEAEEESTQAQPIRGFQ